MVARCARYSGSEGNTENRPEEESRQMQVDWHIVGAVLLLLTSAGVLGGCLSFLVVLASLDRQYPDKGGE
jgi:hypothetical protein